MVAKANEDQDASGSMDEGDDAPLASGALAKAVKKIVAKGKERGYVTYDEINRLLPPAEYTSDQIDETMAMLSDIGINLVEEEPDSDDDTVAADKDKVPSPGEHQFPLAHLDPTDAGAGSGELDFAEKQQVVNRRRPFPKPVAPFSPETLELFVRRDLSEAAVGLNAQRRVADVSGGNEGGQKFLRPGGEQFAFVAGDKIEPHLHLESLAEFFSLELGHSLAKELAVKIEPHRHDVPALGGAENASGAANFQVAHCDPKARA